MVVQPGLCRNWSKKPEDRLFSQRGSNGSRCIVSIPDNIDENIRKCNTIRRNVSGHKQMCFAITRTSVLHVYTVRLLIPGHFYFYAFSKFLLRENDISVLLL